METANTNAQTLQDVLDPVRAAALHVLLERDGMPPGKGVPLPPFWHQLYFWQVPARSDQGRDGHLRSGVFIPDTGLPRRMWAGGVVVFKRPLLCGVPAQKHSMVEAIVRKNGRSGPLAFVTLRHEISQGGDLCVRERQDLVFREDPRPDAPARPAAPARRDETERQRRDFDVPELFRYSALTMNGHRIHYDAPYCRDIEGYPGLVVHAPLLVQHLIAMADAALGGLARFEFRATAPLFAHESAEFCRVGRDLWVRGPDGRLVMEAWAQ